MKVLLVLAAVLHLGWLQEAPEPFRVPNICTEMGPDQGTCGDYNVRWFFNPEDGQCKQFMYSGCGGNENNFKTLEDCEKMCKGNVQVAEMQQKPVSEHDQAATDQLDSNQDEQKADEREPEAHEPMETSAEANKGLPEDKGLSEDKGMPESDEREGDAEEDDEDDGFDDGEEDDKLIEEYLNVGDNLNAEDSQVLKEAMSRFDVSVLKEMDVPDDEADDPNINEQQQEQEQQEEEHQQQQELEQEQQQQQELEQQQQLLQQQQQQQERSVQNQEDLENKRQELMNGEENNNHEQHIQEQPKQMMEQGEPQEQEHDKQSENENSRTEKSDNLEQKQEEEQQEQQEQQQQQQQQQQQLHTGQVDEENKVESTGHVEEPHNASDNKDSHDGGDDDENDDDDGFMEDNGKEVESFLGGLRSEMTPEDREVLLEGVAKFGATVLKRPDEVDDTMEIAPFDDQIPEDANQDDSVSRDMKETQEELKDAQGELEAAKSDIAESSKMLTNEGSATNGGIVDEHHVKNSDDDVDDDDNDNDDDDEPEGIDIDVEYPPIKGMISPEDRSTLADAMHAFDVVEAITDGRKVTGEIITTIPMRPTSEGDEAESAEENGPNEPVDTRTSSYDDEKAKEENPKNDAASNDEQDRIMPQDRQMLNELVSNYDVNVVEGERPSSGREEATNRDGERANPKAADAEAAQVVGLLSPRCTLPPVAGPCRARKLRWFFDLETGTCRSFVYGGCRGNANRFPSKEECLASCLGQQRIGAEEEGNRREPTMPKPVIPVRPTQSPTKKITFMMPLLSFFNKRVSGGPTAAPIHKPPTMERSQQPSRSPLSALFGREAMTVIRRTSVGIRSRQEATRPEGEAVAEEVSQSLSPLRYMIMRAMFKPASRGLRSGGGQPSMAKPTLSRVRVIFPRLQPSSAPSSYQKQQPVVKLSPMRMPTDRGRMPPPPPSMLMPSSQKRGFPQLRRADNPEDDRELPRGRVVFAPKMVRKSEFESLSHDNKHFNNVSPNNRFTLLQVFVNKHGGRRSFDDPSSRSRQQMSPMAKLPAPRSPEPFSQAAKSYPVADYQPMMYPMRPRYGPYLPSMWYPPMPHHYHQYPSPHGYQNQLGADPVSFRPRDSFGSPYKPQPQMVSPPRPRRPVAVRPVQMTSHGNGNQEREERSRLSCLLPLAPGRCKSYQTKWYYNRSSGKCEIFYYTGCAGNANNFETWEECAATCLESPSEPKSTVPSHVKVRPSQESETEMADKEEEKTTVTSTKLPESEVEEKQAMAEAHTETVFVEQQQQQQHDSEPTEHQEPEEKAEDVKEEEDNEVVQERQVVISEANAMSTHYIMLLAVITVVALAIIVLVSISSVHLCRKMKTNKKEKILEAVIKQQLGADIPNLVYTTKPSPEQTEKPQA